MCGPNVSASACPGGDLAEADAGIAGIRPDRGDGVARAGLDPHMRRARRKAEHQQHVGTPLGEQPRQVAVDVAIGDAEDVRGALDIGEGRPAQFCQPRHQRLRSD